MTEMISWLNANIRIPAEAVNVLQERLIEAVGQRDAPSWDDCAYALEGFLDYLIRRNVIVAPMDEVS